MSVISVGGFSFGKRAKTLDEAIANALDSDTIVLHKSRITIDKPAVIDKNLYIQGNNCAITVPRGKCAIRIMSGSVHMSDMHFIVSPQANGVVFDNNYVGQSDFKNVTMQQTKGVLREFYPSLEVGSPQQGQPGCELAMQNCDIAYFDGLLKALQLDSCRIGRLYRMRSNLVAYDFSASNLELTNAYVSNANRAVIDKLTTGGQLNLNGHFTFNNIVFKDMGIDSGGKEVTNYYKARKLIDEYTKATGNDAVDVLVNVFGDKKAKAAAVLANMQFDQTKPFYKRELLTSQFADITLKHSKIPELEKPSFAQQSTLTLDNVEDHSHWTVDHTPVSNRGSKSTLFGGTRKVAGAASVNGALTDMGEMASAPSALKELDEMIGLKSVKKQVHKIIRDAAADDMRRKRGMTTKPPRLNTILAGNAGTGKTTIAEKMGSILYTKGILHSNTFKMYHATDLIGQYVGETRIKTRKAVQAAEGGVFFLDEAYALASGGKNSNNNFGAEAVDELIQDMENNPGKLMVIFAGYLGPMRQLLHINQGLASRFQNFIVFPDYTPKEMLQILAFTLDKDQWHLKDVETAKELQKEFLIAIRPGAGTLGNGRFCRTVCEKLEDQAKARVAKGGTAAMMNMSDNELSEITIPDVQEAMRAVMEQSKNMYGTIR